jgi:hypothetical protein
MPNSHVQFPPSLTGKYFRTYRRGELTTVEADWYRVFSTDRIKINDAVVSTHRIIGTGTSATGLVIHPLFTIEVNSESTVAIAIRRLLVMTDMTVAQTSVMGQFCTFRATAPNGGDILIPSQIDTSFDPTGFVICRCTNSEDGATPLTGESTLEYITQELIWKQFTRRFHTAVNESRAEINSLIPSLCDSTPLLLLPGEALAVQYMGPENGWRSTSHGIIMAQYEEFTSP